MFSNRSFFRTREHGTKSVNERHAGILDAAVKGDTAKVLALVLGADADPRAVQAVNNQGCTAVLLAASRGNTETVRALDFCVEFPRVGSPGELANTQKGCLLQHKDPSTATKPRLWTEIAQ